MLNGPLLNKRFSGLNCCVIIPTYNNQNTIEKILKDTLVYTDKIIVVNDGATDSTPAVLKSFENRITIIHQPKNLGKGMALRTAFKKALTLNYRYAITMDSDGQHFPDDLELFLNRIEETPDSLIIGARNMNSENVPGGSSFGNKFSNFWFFVETGISLPDTQSGYRLYPIERMKKIRYFTSRFEFEIEVIVKAAWNKIPVLYIPIQVFYAKGEERVTHFKPSRDSTRISFLNFYLVILAFSWYRPWRFIQSLTIANFKLFIQDNFFNKEESIIKKALSVAVGIFFGIIPIWGYQLVTAIAFAYFFKLNKAIVIVAANISIPILLPFILYASLKTGELVTGLKSSITIHNIDMQNIKSNLVVYLTGASVLAVVFSIFMGIVTYFILKVIRNKKVAISEYK